MAKCQNLTTKKFFFRQNRLFSLYFRELSDLEQKKNQKIFLTGSAIFLNMPAHPTRQNAQNLDFENFPGHAVFSRG